MKNIIKITALVLVIAMSAITLCSCQQLDDMRDHHAFYTDDTKRTIRFNDQLYKMISTGSKHFVFTDTFYTNFLYAVTEEDVPTLLYLQEGNTFNTNDDKTIICMWGDEGYPEWYVREDMYDKAKDALQNAVLDHYYFGYIVYPEDDDGDRVWSEPYQHNVLLDDDVTKAVNKALATPSKDKLSYTVLSDDAYDVQTLNLYRCDKDMFVMVETECYIVRDRDKYYVWDGNTYDENSICPVSEEDTEIFVKLFKDYPDAHDYDNIRWQFENNDEYYEYYDDEEEGYGVTI